MPEEWLTTTMTIRFMGLPERRGAVSEEHEQMTTIQETITNNQNSKSKRQKSKTVSFASSIQFLAMVLRFNF
ncbi:MAG: hypothetical protein HY665_05325 [Chloroflexi bacterium]|nr:hypothetical protein [Chloroflexota bacterium]